MSCKRAASYRLQKASVEGLRAWGHRHVARKRGGGKRGQSRWAQRQHHAAGRRGNVNEAAKEKASV
eukprot:scaffold238949_cov27-Tisochrysis_lutea.AAC.2